MKVVVELSKEEMESYKNAMCRGFGNSAMRKIINGTPLPKGHGALKDVDAIIAEFSTTKYDWTDCVDIEDLRDFPTIIEADKENKNA